MGQVARVGGQVAQWIALPLATFLGGLAIGLFSTSPAERPELEPEAPPLVEEEPEPAPRPVPVLPPEIAETYHLAAANPEERERLLAAMRDPQSSDVQMGLVIEKFGRDSNAPTATALREFVESPRSAQYPQPRRQALYHLASRNDVYAAHELGILYDALTVRDRLLVMQLLLTNGGSAHVQWLRRGPNIPHRLTQLEQQVRHRYGITAEE